MYFIVVSFKIKLKKSILKHLSISNAAIGDEEDIFFILP